MATDWAADVRKFAPDADEGVIAGIVRYCGIALQSRDSSLVSMGDPAETARVRENFLKKKLGMTQADDDLDRGIAAVGDRMKGVNFKNRVTVYYLLLDHFGLLHLFGKGPTPAASLGAAAAGVAGVAAVGASSLTGGPQPIASTAEPMSPQPVRSTAAAAQPVAARTRTDDGAAAKSGFGWWPWALLALAVLALLWWFLFRDPAPTAAEPAPPSEATSSSSLPVPAGGGSELSALSAAPAEGSSAIPTGAGVTAETRNGKPVVKVYFDTGKTELAPAFASAATGLKDYLASHAGSSLTVSGFNDPTGNAAANAELSKGRAQAVSTALVAAGIPEGSVELVKPATATDTAASNAAARRVEVVVR